MHRTRSRRVPTPRTMPPIERMARVPRRILVFSMNSKVAYRSVGGHIPRPQMIDMLGTLNSLPSQIRFDEPSGAAPSNPFSDSHDLDDVELVTDMLEDMTRDDETQDDFVEALNPNFILPRLVLPPEERSSKWLTVNSPLLTRRS